MTVALDRVEVGRHLALPGARQPSAGAQCADRSSAIRSSLRGSLTYDHPGDFEAAIATITEGRLAPGRIVTDEYPAGRTAVGIRAQWLGTRQDLDPDLGNLTRQLHDPNVVPYD